MPRAQDNFDLEGFSTMAEDDIASYPSSSDFTASNPSTSSTYSSYDSTNGSQSSKSGRRKKKHSSGGKEPTSPWLLKAQVWAWDKFLLFQILILMTVEPLIMKHASPEDLERERERQEAARQ